MRKAPGVFMVVVVSSLIFLSSPLLAQDAKAPLTNDDVIKMVQAKLPDAVVVAKIKSSICKFDTSTDSLIKLKQEGISDPVLAAMADPHPPAASAAPERANITGTGNTLKIPDGAILHVVITDDLSSGTNHVNDSVHFKPTEDLKVGDVVVISKETEGIGHVTAAEGKGRWGKGGNLSFTLDYIKAVDGSNIRLRATSTGQEKSSTGALMLGLSGAFKHGKDVRVSKGAEMTAYIDGDHEVAAALASPGTPKP